MQYNCYVLSDKLSRKVYSFQLRLLNFTRQLFEGKIFERGYFIENDHQKVTTHALLIKYFSLFFFDEKMLRSSFKYLIYSYFIYRHFIRQRESIIPSLLLIKKIDPIFDIRLKIQYIPCIYLSTLRSTVRIDYSFLQRTFYSLF